MRLIIRSKRLFARGCQKVSSEASELLPKALNCDDLSFFARNTTMKAFTIIFGIILCVAASALAQFIPPLPPYPEVFSATIYESGKIPIYCNVGCLLTLTLTDFVSAPLNPSRMRFVFLDIPNKRARINYYSAVEHQESWTLVYKPKGADPAAVSLF